MNKYRAQNIFLVFVFYFAFAVFGFNTNNTFAESGFKTRVPEICYKCHDKLKDALSKKSVHAPFKMGKCNSCHNAHVSDKKGLLRDNINDLCLDCHEGTKKLLNKGNIHGALRKGVCTDCHSAHSSDNKSLLVKPEKKLCWNCHEKLNDQVKKPHVHSPFKEGECASCHDPHASTAKNHMHSSPSKTCKQCHAPRCKAGGVSIAAVTKDMDCTSCHTGHSSNTKGLLGTYGHSAFLDKKCDQCHNPITADKKITLKIAGPKLCLSCHKDTVKFKENDIHGQNSQNACVICHSPHGSQKKSQTVDEAGLCIKCHEGTEKRTGVMERKLKNIKCTPVKYRKCFECHQPLHSSEPYYLKADLITACSRCHEAQHKISHPIGENTFDPRVGRQITCISCHSMHSARAEYMLSYDRKRQLCIQCHEK